MHIISYTCCSISIFSSIAKETSTPIFIGNKSKSLHIKCYSFGDNTKCFINDQLIFTGDNTALSTFEISSNNGEGKIFDVTLQNCVSASTLGRVINNFYIKTVCKDIVKIKKTYSPSGEDYNECYKNFCDAEKTIISID